MNSLKDPCIVCNLQISSSLYFCHIQSETRSAHPTSLLHANLMDCERKVNDFPLTTEDALAFAIRHCLQSILRTEITASIIAGDILKTTATPGRR